MAINFDKLQNHVPENSIPILQKWFNQCDFIPNGTLMYTTTCDTLIKFNSSLYLYIKKLGDKYMCFVFKI